MVAAEPPGLQKKVPRGPLSWVAASTASPAGAPRGDCWNCRLASWVTVMWLCRRLRRAKRASSEECRPVCTRKPKPCPRGGAERLEERPHLTWADAASGMRPGRVGAGGGSRPGASTQLSHVCTSGLPQNRSWEEIRRPVRKAECGIPVFCDPQTDWDLEAPNLEPFLPIPANHHPRWAPIPTQ